MIPIFCVSENSQILDNFFSNYHIIFCAALILILYPLFSKVDLINKSSHNQYSKLQIPISQSFLTWQFHLQLTVISNLNSFFITKGKAFHYQWANRPILVHNIHNLGLLLEFFFCRTFQVFHFS